MERATTHVREAYIALNTLGSARSVISNSSVTLRQASGSSPSLPPKLPRRCKVKTIERLIRMAGGIAALEGHPFYVYKPPFLPLHVRHAGIGPRELPSIVVAQVIQSCCQDHLESEIRFEIKTLNDGDWFWHPLSFRQRSPAFHHEGAGVIEGNSLACIVRFFSCRSF